MDCFSWSYCSILFFLSYYSVYGFFNARPDTEQSHPRVASQFLDLKLLSQRLKRQKKHATSVLRYDIQMFGSSYHIRLRRSLVASSQLRTVYVDEQRVSKVIKIDPTCTRLHYSGSVTNCHQIGICYKGRAAMSRFSQGLRGVIKIGGEDILIEPLPETLLAKRMRFSNVHIARKKLTGDTFLDPDFHLLDKLAESLYSAQSVLDLVPLLNLPKTLIIEVGVFVDKPMVRKLRLLYPSLNDQVMLILATYNAVNLLYEDASVGPIKVTQTIKQIVLDISDGMPQDAKVTEYLNDLCTRYQHEFLSRANRKRDWDLTTALTGLDVYADAEDVTRDAAYKNLKSSAKKIFTVSGVSYGGGMCSVDRNCLVAEFSLLFGNVETIAHETGHTLGMFHDGSGNNCNKSGNKIMSVQRPQRQRSGWSECSRANLDKFVLSGHAVCLIKEEA